MCLITHPPRTAPSTPMSWSRCGQLFVIAALVVLTAVWSGSTAAANTVDSVHVVALVATVDEVLNNIRNLIMAVLAGAATVAVSIAFMRRLFSGGDPGEIEKSKVAFRSAAWGYGGAALAPLLVEILKGIVGA